MKYSLKVMMSTALLFLASQNMAFASEKIGWKDLVPEGFTPPRKASVVLRPKP